MGASLRLTLLERAYMPVSKLTIDPPVYLVLAVGEGQELWSRHSDWKYKPLWVITIVITVAYVRVRLLRRGYWAC